MQYLLRYKSLERNIVQVVILLLPLVSEGRGTLLPRAEGRGLVVGAGDLLQEGVHLPQGQGVVERLERSDAGSSVLAN